MLLTARVLQFEAKRPIIVLNSEDASEIGVKALERVEVKCGKCTAVAIVNVATKLIEKGSAGLYESVFSKLCLKGNDTIEVKPCDPPKSMEFIKARINGKRLSYDEIRSIVEDVVANKLSDVEITAFVMSLHNNVMGMDEITSLSRSISETGQQLSLSKKQLYDKHSVGGVPGDKTSMLVVPIVAAAGLTIPKTSSRAITAPAGTADRMECLAPVEHGIDEIRRIVNRTNGCLVWGGAVDLSPADDIFISVEYPLSIDPLLLPSIMAKKKSVNAKYLAIDIPTGKGMKMKTIGEAHELANQFIRLGKNLGIKVACASTYGEQPIGHGIGPALEAREVLEVLSGKSHQPDLVEKAAHLAGVLLGFSGARNGEAAAKSILKSGKAFSKMKQIIEAQGGDPDIKPSDIPVGGRSLKIESPASGRVWWMDNHAITKLARLAGSPKDKGAGILLHKKIGDKVEKGDVLFEIYADKLHKLNLAADMAESCDAMGVGDISNMIMLTVPEEKEHKRHFILER